MERRLCWIQDKEAPEFCEARQECVKRGKDWSSRGLIEDRPRPAINRITRLAAAGLSIEHAGKIFFSIASHHYRKGTNLHGSVDSRQTG